MKNQRFATSGCKSFCLGLENSTVWVGDYFLLKWLNKAWFQMTLHAKMAMPDLERYPWNLNLIEMWRISSYS